MMTAIDEVRYLLLLSAAELDKMIGQSGVCTVELRYLNSDDILIMEERYQA